MRKLREVLRQSFSAGLSIRNNQCRQHCVKRVRSRGQKLFIDFDGPTIPVVSATSGEIRRFMAKAAGIQTALFYVCRHCRRPLAKK